MDREGIAPQALADELGLDLATVYRYRRGERRPRQAIMRRLHEMSGGEVDANSFFQLDPVAAATDGAADAAA